MTTRDDGKERDYLGLPLFKRLFGAGDLVTMRVRMVAAAFADVDRASLAGALPRHPRVKLHRFSPLVITQSEFVRCADVGDPDGNDYRYREVMLACVLDAGIAGVLFPLVLFLDEPIAVCAGREYHGFPKVPAEVAYDATSARVAFASWPQGRRVVREVMRTRWRAEPGFVGRAIDALQGAAKRVARAAGVDADTADFLTGLALQPAGEVWNLRQLPDLASPRRAVLSQLTRFKPRITEPGEVHLLDGFTLTLPSAIDDPAWSLGRRFFRARPDAPVDARAAIALRWEATMSVAGGEVLDTW